MVKKTVIPLEIDLSADLGEFEFLRKELKQISKESKLADTAFDGLVAGIKNFGKETANTTNGIKGQIAAFDKLRDRIDFQGKAYKEVTSEIIQLNKALATRISLEKEVGAAQETGRRKGRLPAQKGDAAFMGLGIRNLWGDKDFRKQQLDLYGLLSRGPGQATDDQLKFLNSITQTISGKFAGTYRDQDFSGTPEFQKKIRRSNAAYIAAELKQKGSGEFAKDVIPLEKLTNVGAELNAIQKEALGIRDTGNIRSKDYANVLQEIIARETAWTQIKKAQNTVADNENAKLKANQFLREKDIKLQRARAKSFLFQKDYKKFWDDPRLTGVPKEASGQRREFKSSLIRPNIDELQKWNQKPWILRSIEGFLATQLGPRFQSPSWKKMFSEQSEKANPLGEFRRNVYQTGKQQITGTTGDSLIPPPYLRKGIGISAFEPDENRLRAVMRGKKLGPFVTTGKDYKKGILDPLDYFDLGARQPAPKTDIGLGDELSELQSLLPNLVRGSKEWVEVTILVEEKIKEIDATVKKGNEALKKRREEIAKAVDPKFNQKLLPAAGETTASKKQREAFLAGKDTGFGADQYGPQQSWMQRASESQKQFVKRLEESVKAGKLNINTLGKQRAKLDEIRNSLDPTSAAFKRATQAIAKTDQALAKLNANKFSGRNIGRTAQSILGASFFGGPAGFLGSTLGAGVEALRPGGDMAQGAVTGGLVASQVLQPIGGFAAESANYTAMIEKSKIALEAATKVEGDAIASKKAYAVALSTAAGVTERFNVPQELAARGMTRLSAAVIGAGGNIHNAGIAFENISAAIKATGGSTEDTKAAVTAMVQIFSKGRVSAEELSGQLGERFPAAVTLFAEANNMTTKELQKGLKDGAIGLDKLWNFVLKLGDKYKDVAEGIGAASVEAGVRSQIAWNEVKLAVGKALQPIGADLQVIGAEILTNLVPVLQLAAKVLGAIGRAVSFTAKAVVENFDKMVLVIGTFGSTVIWANRVALAAFIKTLKVKLTAALANVVNSMWLAKIATLGFSGAIKLAKAAVIAFTASLMANPIIAVATGITLAATAAWHFGRQWQRTVKEIKSGKMTISEAKIEIAELEKKLEETDNEKTRARLQAQIEMYKAAVKAKQEINKRANLDEANTFDSAPTDTGKWKEVIEYVNELGMGGKHIQEVFINAFKGMEDALTNFVMTGKLKFKEFARSVIADIARMIIKQMMFNMLSGFTNRLGNQAAAIKEMNQALRITMPSNPSFVGVGANTNYGATVTSPGSELFGGMYNPREFYEGQSGIVPFARGGIVDKPTYFAFSKGVGLMSEKGPEAIMPLKRGKGGRLGVEVAGGSGDTVVNISVDAKGTSVEGQDTQAKMLGKMLSTAVQAEIARQKRPGGILS